MNEILLAELAKLFTEFMPLYAGVTKASVLLVAISMVLFWTWMFVRQLSYGTPIDILKLLRPFFLCLLLLAYPKGIALAKIVVFDTLATATYKLALEQKGILDAALSFESHKEASEKALSKYSKYSPTEVREKVGRLRVFKSIKDITHVANSIGSYIVNNVVHKILYTLLAFLAEAALHIISAISIILLIILATVGPIAISFSYLPIFASSAIEWFSRFISVSLWIPIANIIAAILTKVQSIMVNNTLAAIAEGDIASSTAAVGKDLGYLIVLILSIVCYFMVPKIASYIVSAGNLNTLGAMASRALQTVTAKGATVFKK